MRSIILIVSLIAFMLIGAASAKELKRDPATGLIRILYIGAPFWASPYQVFKYDPLLVTTPVAGNLYGIPVEQVQRAMRIYMPRTRAKMVETYDIIGLDDTTHTVHQTQTIQWMRDGCIEDGLGLFMAGGFESFGGGAGFPSWGDTVLDDVMPVQCTGSYGPDGKNVITEPEDEFMKSIPWDGYEKHDVFGGYNVVLLRDGARELSRMIRLGPGGGGPDPGWVWWDVGKGRFFASAPGFRGGSAGKGFILWKHYGDFVCNMVYFLAGLTPPSDINMLYATRLRLREVYDSRQMILGTIDFISRFGADTRKVDEKLIQAEAELREAKTYFVNLDLVRSKESADRAFATLEEAYKLAFEARDAALFWIFLTEWLVVTAAGLVCGSVVWALMIKRKLYREVSVTRGGRTDGR